MSVKKMQASKADFEEVSSVINDYISTFKIIRSKTLSLKPHKPEKDSHGFIDPLKVISIIPKGRNTLSKVDLYELLDRFQDITGLQVIETLRVNSNHICFYYTCLLYTSPSPRDS